MIGVHILLLLIWLSLLLIAHILARIAGSFEAIEDALDVLDGGKSRRA